MNTLEYSAEVLKAIAQLTRLRIIELLRDCEHASAGSSAIGAMNSQIPPATC